MSSILYRYPNREQQVFCGRYCLKASFTFLPIGENRGFLDVYAILPWTGVMLLGYSMGRFFLPSYGQSERRKVLAKLGLSLIALFVVLRYLNIYGDPKPWSVQKTGFIPFSLYQCNQVPGVAAIPLHDPGHITVGACRHRKVQNKFTGILIIYGRVPFLYYVMHFT